MKNLLLILIFLLSGLSLTASARQNKQGDVAMKTGKMMVMKDGQWTQMKENTTMKDGTLVKTDGTVIDKTGRQRKLAEGESVSVNGYPKKDNPKTYKKGQDSLLKGE